MSFLSSSMIAAAADKLAAMYDAPFGGKAKGRFRIATKLVRQICQCRRLSEAEIGQLTRALFERGYVLIDMDSFFVLLSANSFVNYRRANEDCLR
jgi:hypothetical protein